MARLRFRFASAPPPETFGLRVHAGEESRKLDSENPGTGGAAGQLRFSKAGGRQHNDFGFDLREQHAVRRL